MNAPLRARPVQVIGTDATARAGAKLLPAWWPIAVLTIGYPIWWLAGLSMLAYPLVSFILIPNLIKTEHLKVPRGFGWWVLFVIWVLLSATQVEATGRLFSFGYRFSVYFSATILFLYIYNQSEQRLPTRRAIGLLVGLWSAIAVGGLIGTVAPRLEVDSVAEMVLPRSMFSNPLVHALAHPQFAQVSRLFGQEIGRPHALFPYTNGWGSAFGILLPITVAWLYGRTASPSRRTAVLVLAGLSIFSVVASLNRGLWVSIAVCIVYTTWRFAGKGQFKPVLISLLAVGVVVVALIVSPAGDLVSSRAEGGHSDDGRSSLYTQSIDKGLERPVLGWGVPQPREDKDDGPSVGTHGQVWLVLVGQGVIGLGLYLTWWVTAILRTWRQRTPTGIWMHAALIVVLVQSLFYEHTPVQLPLVMMVAALLFRARSQTASTA